MHPHTIHITTCYLFKRANKQLCNSVALLLPAVRPLSSQSWSQYEPMRSANPNPLSSFIQIHADASGQRGEWPIQARLLVFSYQIPLFLAQQGCFETHLEAPVHRTGRSPDQPTGQGRAPIPSPVRRPQNHPPHSHGPNRARWANRSVRPFQAGAGVRRRESRRSLRGSTQWVTWKETPNSVS